MPLSQNGFPVLVAPTPALVRIPVQGVPFVMAAVIENPVRHFTAFLHALEPVTEPGWDGGYAHRKIAGTDVWSNHASGTAFDWNASQHPRDHDDARYDGWTSQEVRMIRWYLATAHGRVWEWGADFSTPDPMHFEIRSRAYWLSDANPWKH